MGIGTSKGAFYRDEAHYLASQWDDLYDDNEPNRKNKFVPRDNDKMDVKPDELGIGTADDNIVGPGELEDRKEYLSPIIKASNELVPPNKMGITDQDIDTAVNVGMGASGGGLKLERIGRAALQYGDDLFTGVTHGHAFEQLMNKFADFDYKTVKDGFITTTGRFVNRDEARAIAEQSKQIGKGEGNNAGLGLISEDLLR